MKPLYVPPGGEPGDVRVIDATRLGLLQLGYDASLQEVFDVHVWLAQQRGLPTGFYLRPITADEFDAALAAGVFQLERGDEA